jgi:fucose 4-O-acetylase-like acetyltransferase
MAALIVAGNFMHPFAAAGNKLACLLHNFISIFNVPAFVIISGRAPAYIFVRHIFQV